MADSPARLHLRRELEAHLAGLGYSCERLAVPTTPAPEIARVSPVRRRIAYGETVLRNDLRRRHCHDRLQFFSQRRTRQGSSILFFIAVLSCDQRALEALLARLEIRSGARGGHVHVVSITLPKASRGARNGTK